MLKVTGHVPERFLESVKIITLTAGVRLSPDHRCQQHNSFCQCDTDSDTDSMIDTNWWQPGAWLWSKQAVLGQETVRLSMDRFSP